MYAQIWRRWTQNLFKLSYYCTQTLVEGVIKMGSSVRPGVVGWDKGVYILRHRGVHWLTVGQGLLSLQQVRVEEGCFYFFCFFTVIFLSPLSLSFISSTISSISLLTFSGRRYKMTHKGWRVIKPQDNQKPSARPSVHLSVRRHNEIGILWAQLLLQSFTDLFETL